MSLVIERLAHYLGLAEELADALEEILDAADPDGEDFVDIRLTLNSYRRTALELCGQQCLPLEPPA